MVSLAETQVDLFGPTLPSPAQVKLLAAQINSGESARIAFTERVERSKSSLPAAGIGLVLLEKYKEAAELLKKAPESADRSFWLACAYRGMEMFDDALKHFDRAVHQQMDSLAVSLEKVETLRLAGRFGEAQQELKTCGNFERVSAEFHYQRARLAAAEGEYEQAIADLETAVELDPHHMPALFQLAYAWDLRGNDDAAIDLYRQVVRNDPVYVSALLNLSVLCEERNDYDKAAQCVQAVLRSHPNHARARLFLKDIESSRTMVYDEEMERRQDQRNRILEIPISDFELSVRSRNCLKKMNLNTLGDLVRITEAELLSYKNFGETSLGEIKRILESKGLRLGMAVEGGNGAFAASAPEAAGVSDEVLNKCVDDIELSVRSRRCLSRLNIRTLGDLVTKTEAELLGCKNFGVTSLNEIKDRLGQFGLALRKLD